MKKIKENDVKGDEKGMFMRITGKEETLKEIEKAMNLLREAEKILFNLPNNIGLELENETEDKKDNATSEN